MLLILDLDTDKKRNLKNFKNFLVSGNLIFLNKLKILCHPEDKYLVIIKILFNIILILMSNGEKNLTVIFYLNNINSK